MKFGFCLQLKLKVVLSEATISKGVNYYIPLIEGIDLAGINPGPGWQGDPEIPQTDQSDNPMLGQETTEQTVGRLTEDAATGT